MKETSVIFHSYNYELFTSIICTFSCLYLQICSSTEKNLGLKSEAGKINMFYGVTIGVSTAGSTHIWTWTCPTIK